MLVHSPGFENGDGAWRGGGRGGGSSYSAAPPVIGIDDVSLNSIGFCMECTGVYFCPSPRVLVNDGHLAAQHLQIHYLD